jgi:GT2 family glycosyltransferase
MSISTAPTPTHAERARWYADRGVRFRDSGDLVRARELFRRAIAHDTQAEGHYRLLMGTYDAQRDARRLSVVIPTWNRLHHLRRCLESLRRNSFYSNEIIFIDNNSQDGTVEYLREQPDVRTIFCREEMPVTRAANLGAAAATSDIVGFLNDDVEVMPGWDLEIAELLATEPRAGAAIPLIVNGDGHVTAAGHYEQVVSLAYPWIGRLAPVDTRGVVNPQLGDLPHVHTPRECDHGDFPFLTRACLERVGPLDEGFRHYFADPDYGFRVQQAGFRNVLCPTSVVVHHEVSKPNMQSERVEVDRRRLAEKWLLMQPNAHSTRTFFLLDEYLRQLGAERFDESEPAGGDVADLVTWIPDDCRDIVDIGAGSEAVATYLREEAGKHVRPCAGEMSFQRLGFAACDLILARDALARSGWPVITLMEFNRVLELGGYVLLTVPPCEARWIDDPAYHSVLSDAQWRRAFRDARFSVVRAEACPGPHGLTPRYLLRKDAAIIGRFEVL